MIVKILKNKLNSKIIGINPRTKLVLGSIGIGLSFWALNLNALKSQSTNQAFFRRTSSSANNNPLLSRESRGLKATEWVYCRIGGRGWPGWTDERNCPVAPKKNEKTEEQELAELERENDRKYKELKSTLDKNREMLEYVKTQMHNIEKNGNKTNELLERILKNLEKRNI